MIGHVIPETPGAAWSADLKRHIHQVRVARESLPKALRHDATPISPAERHRMSRQRPSRFKLMMG